MDNFSSRNRVLVASTIAAFSGAIGFSGYLALTPFCALFAVAISMAKSYPQSILIAFIYFLSASHGLMSGAYVFTNGDLLVSFGYPFLANLILALPFVLVTRFRSVGLIAALMIITIPPFGHIGWANPIR